MDIGNDPASLNELIHYQSDSVVSRTLVDKPTGTVTLFAFAEGQGLSEHTAPYDAIIYVLDGTAQISVAKRASPVKAGQILIIPANTPHALKAEQAFKMLLTMIKS